MNLDIRIRQQKRKSMAMRLTPKGIDVLIPDYSDKESQEVREFIETGLAKLSLEQRPPAFEALTKEELLQMVESWSTRLGVQVKRVQVREMAKKWASCSSGGVLTINTAALALPRELVEYLVCHELTHLRICHHGKGFRAAMAIFIPDWQDKHRALMLMPLRAIKAT